MHRRRHTARRGKYRALGTLRAEFLADDFMMSKRLREKGTKTLVCATPDFNRSNGLKIRPEGMGEDALQNNKQTGGNLAAYALLKQA